ncbi:MAG: trigger factor [Patescibacteria group bacterium]
MFEKKLYKIKNIDTKTPCEVTLEVEITKEAIEQSKDKALKQLNEQVKIDGFRPGHVPEKVLLEKVGDYAVTEEACRTYIDSAFGDIIIESKHVPVNQPTIAITKLAPGEDAELKITFATPPVIDLGDYKKIAKKHNKEKANVVEVNATEEEIEAMLMDLRKQVAHMDYHAKSEHGHDSHDHDEIAPAELNDAFAAKVGPFKTVEEVKAAVAENVRQTKAQTNLEKFRISLIDEVIADSKIDYPSFFLAAEQNIMIEELKNDLAKNGIPYGEYLQHIGKTEEVLKDERKDIAEKRVKTQLVLSKISVLEDLKPAEDLVTSQMEEILKMHPQAEKENVKAFVERFEMNQLVWKFLEESK